MVDTTAVSDARKAIENTHRARMEEGKKLGYWCALVYDRDYDLAPALRLVTQGESMPATRKMIGGILDYTPFPLLHGLHPVVHFLEDSDPLILRQRESEGDRNPDLVEAVEVHVALSPGPHLTRYTSILRVSLGLDRETEFGDHILLGFDKRPTGWPP